MPQLVQMSRSGLFLQARDLVSSEADPSQGPAVLSLIEALDNQTAIVSYESILDIAVVSEAMSLLLRKQVKSSEYLFYNYRQ